MDTVKKPEHVVLGLDTDDRDAKRERRFARATEAFQKRAEESERCWLAALGGGQPRR